MLDILGMLSDDKLDEFLEDQPGEDSYPFEISDDFETKIIGLLDKKQKEEKRSAGFRRFMQVAATVSFVILAGMFTIENVDAFRIPILQFFYDRKENTVDIRSDLLDVRDDAVLPEYIPDGYSFEKSMIRETIKISTFVNGQDVIAIWQMHGEMVMKDDAEFKTSEHRVIDGEFYYISEDMGKREVSFQRYGQIFRVSGKISEKEIMQIVKSI